MPESEELKLFSDQFWKKMEEADVITLFRHVFPDPDATGSQLGLKLILKNRFPDKKILALGDNGPEGMMDEASDEEIRNSAAVVLDASTAERIDDQRYADAKDILRIDHHIKTETVGNPEWVDTDATATCEMIALLADELNLEIPEDAAQLLYEGLIADNLRFSIAKTSPETFRAAGILVRSGVNLPQAELDVFSGDYQDFVYETCVREKSFRKEKALFAVMSAEDYLSAGADFSLAKTKVFALGGISDIEIWALFTMMEDGMHYSASLRSRKIMIRDIAAEYGGGGHDLASGIKNLTAGQVGEIIRKLTARSLESEEN